MEKFSERIKGFAGYPTNHCSMNFKEKEGTKDILVKLCQQKKFKGGQKLFVWFNSSEVF